MIGSRTTHIFDWLLASVEFVNLVMPSRWVEPVVHQAFCSVACSHKCVRPSTLRIQGIGSWSASWSWAARLLLFSQLPGSGLLIDLSPPPLPRWSHPRGGCWRKNKLRIPPLVSLLIPSSVFHQCSPTRNYGVQWGASPCAPTAHQNPPLEGWRPQSHLEIPLWHLTSLLMFLM